MEDAERIQLVHPEPGKQMPRISRRKYELVKHAILQLIPEGNPGYPFSQLADGVASQLTPEQVAEIGSIGWYTTGVKLDLEAQGIIERIPGISPQRLRRARLPNNQDNP